MIGNNIALLVLIILVFLNKLKYNEGVKAFVD